MSIIPYMCIRARVGLIFRVSCLRLALFKPLVCWLKRTHWGFEGSSTFFLHHSPLSHQREETSKSHCGSLQNSTTGSPSTELHWIHEPRLKTSAKFKHVWFYWNVWMRKKTEQCIQHVVHQCFSLHFPETVKNEIADGFKSVFVSCVIYLNWFYNFLSAL